jgi:hypothetical protein
VAQIVPGALDGYGPEFAIERAETHDPVFERNECIDDEGTVFPSIRLCLGRSAHAYSEAIFPS